MAKIKGATITDQYAHVCFDRIEFCNVPTNNQGHYCRICGTQLQTMYHEERLYSVHCPVCETVTLVKAGSHGKAEGMVGLSKTEYWSTDMTIPEAIQRIRGHMEVHHIGEPPHIYIKQALDMAIAALTTQGARTPEKLQRLDAYEATGLTPEQITTLASDKLEQVANMLVDTVPQLVAAIVERLPQLVEAAVNDTVEELQEG